MKNIDPSASGVLAASELRRRTRSPLEFAMNKNVGHLDNLGILMDRLDGPLGLVRRMQNDPSRDIVDTMLGPIRGNVGLSNTLRAIEDTQKQRELFIRTLAGTEVLRQRVLATTAFDTGVLRTAELIRRNSDTLASAIAATRPLGDVIDLASSIVQRMDVLRFTGMGVDALPRSATQVFAEHHAKARRVFEELNEADTEEQRAALLVKLIAIVAAALNSVSIARRDVVLGLTIVLAAIGFAADVTSLLPSEPPPEMAEAQVQMLDETRRNVDTLLQEFQDYRRSEHNIDEAYVADLPRAELSRPAMMREEPRREGKALLKAPAGTVLAIAGTQGRWRLAFYRDPLTDELAQAWIYGSAVALLDGQ